METPRTTPPKGTRQPKPHRRSLAESRLAQLQALAEEREVVKAEGIVAVTS